MKGKKRVEWVQWELIPSFDFAHRYHRDTEQEMHDNARLCDYKVGCSLLCACAVEVETRVNVRRYLDLSSRSCGNYFVTKLSKKDNSSRKREKRSLGEVTIYACAADVACCYVVCSPQNVSEHVEISCLLLRKWYESFGGKWMNRWWLHAFHLIELYSNVNLCNDDKTSSLDGRISKFWDLCDMSVFIDSSSPSFPRSSTHCVCT